MSTDETKNADDSGATNTNAMQLVPESVLKRRHDLDELKAKRAAQAISNPRGNRKIHSSKSSVVKVRKPEKFLSAARSRLHHKRRYDRVSKKGMQSRAVRSKATKVKAVPLRENDDINDVNAAAVETKEVTVSTNSHGSKVVFAVRIREGHIPKEVRRALGRLRLRNANEGVFLRYDASTKKMLNLVDPWVSYGTLSEATVLDLLRRRGHGKIDGSRTPLSDNTLVEKELGEKAGIVCVEDLAAELSECGANFTTVNRFLWPFRLSDVRSKFRKDKLNDKGGKKDETGDRGEEMDDAVRSML